MNSLSTSLYDQLPTAHMQHTKFITSPQVIKSGSGRLLGVGLTARFELPSAPWAGCWRSRRF